MLIASFAEAAKKEGLDFHGGVSTSRYLLFVRLPLTWILTGQKLDE